MYQQSSMTRNKGCSRLDHWGFIFIFLLRNILRLRTIMIQFNYAKTKKSLTVNIKQLERCISNICFAYHEVIVYKMRIDIGYRTRNRERTLLHLYDNHSNINSILLTLRRSIPSIAGATAAHPVQMALGKIQLTKSSLGMFWAI